MRRAGISLLPTAGLLVGLTAGLAACGPTKSLQPESPGPQISSDGDCHADRVAWAVGQAGTEQVFARAWKESGAGLIRPIGPNQPITRDIKPDRLNLHIDANNIITAVDCR